MYNMVFFVHAQNKQANLASKALARFRRIRDTIREGGLFGATSNAANPWQDDLAALTAERARTVLNRSYNLSKMPAEEAEALVAQYAKSLKTPYAYEALGANNRHSLFKAVQNEAKHLKDTLLRRNTGLSAEDLARKELARHYDISKFKPEEIDNAVAAIMSRTAKPVVDSQYARNPISAAIRSGLGDINDVANPFTLMFGNRLSRAQAGHDFYRGGLIGEGSSLRKALRVPDFGKTISGTLKPFMAAGTLWPAGSIANRVINPEAHDDGLIKGVSKDLGWYVGATTGAPMGIAGFVAGTAAGENLGGYVGDTIERGIQRVRGR